MTPNDIGVLLHCHTTPQKHPRADAPAVREALRTLETNGLIEQREDGYYHATGRGRAHIEQLCSLPWPVAQWVGCDGKAIDYD